MQRHPVGALSDIEMDDPPSFTPQRPYSDSIMNLARLTFTALFAVLVLTGCSEDSMLTGPDLSPKMAQGEDVVAHAPADLHSSFMSKGGQTAVCHIPPGRTAQDAVYMEVGGKALAAHLGHGDGTPGNGFDAACNEITWEFTADSVPAPNSTVVLGFDGSVLATHPGDLPAGTEGIFISYDSGDGSFLTAQLVVADGNGSYTWSAQVNIYNFGANYEFTEAELDGFAEDVRAMIAAG